MKHRENISEKEPNQIGLETATIVGEHLGKLGFEGPPDFLGRIERFASALALWGASTNLTAAPDNPAELAFHILDCLAPVILALQGPGSGVGELFGFGRRVLDLGSGAGFPGLILAAATDATFTLLEARRKRVSFLTVVATEMIVGNVAIASSHRSPEALPADFDVVTARAFAQPAVFYRSAASALRHEGIAILYANPEQDLDLNAATAAGFGGSQLLRYEVPRQNRSISRLLAVCSKI